MRSPALLAGATALAACSTANGGKDLAGFELALASQDSATAALAQWCTSHGIADAASMRAMPVPGPAMPPPPDFLRLLAPGPGEHLAYRHVRLVCGDKVLSNAHNWYVPARLPPDMNRELETSDTPFGEVIAPLHFTRQRLGTLRAGDEGCPDDTLLAHRALLMLPDKRPVSAVVECYTEANLADPG